MMGKSLDKECRASSKQSCNYVQIFFQRVNSHNLIRTISYMMLVKCYFQENVIKASSKKNKNRQLRWDPAHRYRFLWSSGDSHVGNLSQLSFNNNELHLCSSESNLFNLCSENDPDFQSCFGWWIQLYWIYLGSVNKILIPITATECILIPQIFFWLSFKIRYL